MMNQNQETEVWRRVMALSNEKPEPVERPYPTEPALPRPEPIPRPYPTEPALPEYPPQEPYQVLLDNAMAALRTYRYEEERSRGYCKRLWQQLAYYQNQQCHRLLMALQRCM